MFNGVIDSTLYKITQNWNLAEKHLRLHIALTERLMIHLNHNVFSKELANAYSALSCVLEELGKNVEAKDADRKALEFLTFVPSPF